MRWEDILKIVATAIASVGGAGAIIWALSSFFGKMWANKILEKQKAEFQKDIEEYKNALSCELENVKATNEKLTYISKSQYDLEISSIKSLTQASSKVLLMCFSIVPYNKELLKNESEIIARHDNHCQNFMISMNSFMDIYGSSLAFVEKDISKLFDKFLSLCRDLFDFYDRVYDARTGIPKKYVELFYEKDKKISKTHNEIIDTIKQHLKEIRIAD